MLACLETANAQLSYVTTGQAVPDDIEVGQRNAMVQLVLGGPRMLAKVTNSAGVKCKTKPSSEVAVKNP
jgi:flagellar biosynthesis GTPase FlhF